MNRAWPRASIVLASLLAAASAHAQLVESTFAVGAEEWRNVTLPYPSAVPATVLADYSPTWISNLGGYIRLNDPDGSGQSGNCQYWAAPAAYLGDKSMAYGGTLAFDLANSLGGFGSFHQEDIILEGSGITLVYDMNTVPVGAFTNYIVPLSEAGWRTGGLAGPTPTSGEFRWALASLANLYIRAEYQLGPDVQFLDNVVMTVGTLGVESAAWPRVLTLAPPGPNPSRGTVQVRFVTPRSGEGAVEVFDASGRHVATLARGSFAAGPHVLAWNGRGANGRAVPAGLYWARVRVGSESASRAIVRVR